MSFIKRNLPYFAWLTAVLATGGSLFFSWVMHLPPCVLCWYQRIVMYPMVVIMTVAMLRKETRITPYYILPLGVIGWFVAAYHVLLYYHVIPDTLAPCATGVSCTTRLVEWFGFVTIPMLSLIAFTLIIGLMIGMLRYHKND